MRQASAARAVAESDSNLATELCPWRGALRPYRLSEPGRDTVMRHGSPVYGGQIEAGPNRRIALATALLSPRPGRAQRGAIIDGFKDSTRCDGIEQIRGNRQEAYVEVGQTVAKRLPHAAAVAAFEHAPAGRRGVEGASVIRSNRESSYS
jgi:hypothetical protein